MKAEDGISCGFYDAIYKPVEELNRQYLNLQLTIRDNPNVIHTSTAEEFFDISALDENGKILDTFSMERWSGMGTSGSWLMLPTGKNFLKDSYSRPYYLNSDFTAFKFYAHWRKKNTPEFIIIPNLDYVTFHIWKYDMVKQLDVDPPKGQDFYTIPDKWKFFKCKNVKR